MADITLNNELRKAVKADNCDEVRRLLENGADPNWYDVKQSLNENETRTLSIAIEHASPEVVRVLLQYGANVNCEDIFHGVCPLPQAIVQHKDPDIVRLLIEAGADINHRLKNGQTSMIYLVSDGTLSYGELLPLVDKIKDIQERFFLTGETYLHLVRGREEDDNKLALLEKFINAGISVHSRDFEGDTPLHNFASICCIDSLSFLVDCGANIHAINNDKETALHILADNSNYLTFVKCLDYLVKKGADVNSLDSYGRTILHHTAAAEETSGEVIHELIKYGVATNIRDVFGKNEIQSAVSKIQSGFSDAAISQCVDVIKALIAAGIDINAPDLDGLSALHVATNKHSKVLLQALLDLGADVCGKSNCGVTPLHLASLRLDLGPQLIDWYVKHGFSLDDRDAYGSTPLHCAVWFREQTVVKCLLQNGADSCIADKTGTTPEDVAKMIHYDDYMVLSETFKDLPRVVSGETLVHDFHGNDPFEECPFSEYIYIDSGQELVPLAEWKEHISFHENAIKKFVDTILHSEDMGLFFNVEANHKLPLLVKELMSVLADRVAQRNPLFHCNTWLAGSVFEGTKTGVTDEFDYIWRLSEFSKNFMPVESPSFPSGFVKMKIKNDVEQSLFADFIDAEGYMDGRSVIFTLYSLVNEELFVLNKEREIPDCLMVGNVLDCSGGNLSSLSFYYYGQHAKFISISVDVVPTMLPLDWTPKDFSHEKSLVLQNVKQKMPFSIVMKTPDGNFVEAPTFYFRKSYASWEQSAIRSFPNYIRKSYIIVKALVESSYFPKIVNSKTMDVSCFITSYRLKMCFLHQLEKALHDADPSLHVDETDTEQCNKVSVEWVRRIVKQFGDFIQTDNLPSFFEPEKNLLLMEGAAEVFNKYLYEGPVACLDTLLDALH